MKILTDVVAIYKLPLRKKILNVLFLMIAGFGVSAAAENVINQPLIGDRAKSFTAESTKGSINFPEDYWNKWVVLFSHPADFTPVCTSEIMAFAEKKEEFDKLGCELIGLSVDGVSSHVSWLNEISKIKYNGMENVQVDFPIISDINLEISKKYGMIHPKSSKTHTIRSVFIIDDRQKIRAVLTYPVESGRNIDEILRLVRSIQLFDSGNIATPADWQPGDDVIVLPSPDAEDLMELFNNQGSGYTCPAWFFCLKPLKL